MKQEHEMTPGVLVPDDMSAGDYKARCAVLEAELADLRGRVCVPDVSTMARVLSDRSADACNIDRTDNWAMYGGEYIEDVQAMLAAPAPVERVAVWVEKLPVPTNGACAQLARIDAALARQGKESN